MSDQRKMNRLLKNLLKRIKQTKKRKNVKDTVTEEWNENPYLFQFRSIMEQILEKKQLSYKEFAPVLIDEEKPEMLVMEEDIFIVLKQLERDLNALTILTDRPRAFLDFAEHMKEETGLLVSILEKKKLTFREFASIQGNVMIDFQKNGHFLNAEKKDGYCYIPIYKIPWKKGENLDIIVPIGYNTVIVKGVKNDLELETIS
ncbi:MAG: hypothetical protein PUB46_03225 [Lachnospiraceae bacterium]|uniref:hypothetical protein n=1 Tax=Roseburia hominis TaxID=301301 RepID=UPI001F37F529|nr:hypothetical protein [Roseburia hominis]MCI5712573.1 hypothetical protein [Lachnospiraceae bacterium]MDD6169078.1 hypothetical protein [Lachnospiraceae bacterium]